MHLDVARFAEQYMEPIPEAYDIIESPEPIDLTCNSSPISVTPEPPCPTQPPSPTQHRSPSQDSDVTRPPSPLLWSPPAASSQSEPPSPVIPTSIGRSGQEGFFADQRCNHQTIISDSGIYYHTFDCKDCAAHMNVISFANTTGRIHFQGEVNLAARVYHGMTGKERLDFFRGSTNELFDDFMDFAENRARHAHFF
jgi:hypothetical protein